MTSESSTYQGLIERLARGDMPIADLPLKDEGFWLFVFTRAAHPGRTARTSRSATAAERLVYRHLGAAESKARQAGALKALESTDRSTRRQAVRYLHEADINKATLSALTSVVHDRDPEIRLEAMRLLAAHPTADTAPTLIDLLTTAFDYRETLASEALVKLGAPAVRGVTAMLDNRDARIRWRAALCLTKIAGEGVKTTLPGLLKAFHDDSPDVSWVATDGLLALGPDVSLDVLRSVLAQRLTPAEGRSLHHYAEHATPRTVFQHLIEATRGSAIGAATFTAVDETLKTLETRR